jgi:hypothetical protein
MSRGYNSPYCLMSQQSAAISGRRVARANGRLGTPDCPVHQMVPRPNDWLRLIWKEIVHRTVWCTTRQKARIAFQVDLQRILAALGL